MSIMQEMTFLSIEQIFGEKRLEIIKHYGTRCAITDFAILLDGFVLNNYHILGGYSLKERTGSWMTKSSYNDDYSYIVDHRGYKDYSNNLKRQNGIRPVLLCNFIYDYLNEFKSITDSIIEFEYGEYPQTVVSEKCSRELEIMYNLGILETTNKFYTTDTTRTDVNSSARFMARDHVEYEYNSEKFIRVVTQNSYCNGKLLSDGRIIHPKNVYWIRVEPITWIMDLNDNIILSKNILLSGLQYNSYDNINHNFDDNSIHHFMNTKLIKDIIPSQKKIRKKVKSLY